MSQWEEWLEDLERSQERDMEKKPEIQQGTIELEERLEEILQSIEVLKELEKIGENVEDSMMIAMESLRELARDISGVNKELEAKVNGLLVSLSSKGKANSREEIEQGEE